MTENTNHCEGCHWSPVAGTRWPAEADEDHSRSWVERCDTCATFETDESAAQAVAEWVDGGEVRHDRLHGGAGPVQPHIVITAVAS